MSRVLVIDDDASTLVTYKGILREAGYEVATAALGEDGLAAAEHKAFDVVLCDQRLPDQLGVEVVTQIRAICRHTAIVIVTGWGTPELVIEAKRAGATAYAEKPLIGAELVTVVEEALRVHPLIDVSEAAGVRYATRRWADIVARGVHLPEDPRTIGDWCRGAAIAQSTLKKRCEAVRVTPKDSLDLVRLTRIVVHHAGTSWDLQERLNILDDRTVRALMKRSGVAGYSLVPHLESFLSQQRLIVQPAMIAELRSRLVRLQTF